MNSHSTLAETRAQRRRQDATARVLTAATTLFARKGFAETSMASIAEEADVSVGTLYNLFESKDALYRKLIDGKAARFHTRLVAAIAQGRSARDSLDRYLEEYVAVFVDEAVFIRLYYSVNVDARFSLRASLANEARRLYDDGLAQLAGVLERGTREGELRLPATPYRTAVCCQAVICELLLLYADDPEQHPADVVLAEAKQFVYRTLSIAAPSPAPVTATPAGRAATTSGEQGATTSGGKAAGPPGDQGATSSASEPTRQGSNDDESTA